MCKCYCGVLEQLVKSNPSFKGSGCLTVKMTKRLVSAARCVIRTRNQEKDRAQALILLRKDLVNRPCHCFGNHTHYSSDFCATARDQQQPTSSHNDGTEDGEDPDDDENDLEGTHIVADLWNYNNSTTFYAALPDRWGKEWENF